MPEHEYNHFILLFVAVRICSCSVYKKYHPLASKLFALYIDQYKTIYGKHHIGSNVHNLIHIVEDLKNCNIDNLSKISTYKYENTLRLLGLKLKHTNRPLEQVVCRIMEENKVKSNHQNNTSVKAFKPKVSHEYEFENRKVFRTIEIAPNVSLSNRKSNNSWFLTKKKEIVKFDFADGNDFKLFGKKVKENQSFFIDPISSIKLDIYESAAELDGNLKSFDIDCIEAKMIRLSYKDKFVFIPLLHSLENLSK